VHRVSPPDGASMKPETDPITDEEWLIVNGGVKVQREEVERAE
jgi:hypothetical protein